MTVSIKQVAEAMQEAAESAEATQDGFERLMSAAHRAIDAGLAPLLERLEEDPFCEFSFLVASQCGHCLGVTLDPDLEELVGTW